MLNYFEIFGRASTRQEKLKADKIALMLALNQIKEAVDYAAKHNIDAKIFGKISKFVNC